MTIVEFELDPKAPLTEEEIEMLHHAAELPCVPDEDAPELSPAQIAQFRRTAEERDRQRHPRPTDEDEQHEQRKISCPSRPTCPGLVPPAPNAISAYRFSLHSVGYSPHSS